MPSLFDELFAKMKKMTLKKGVSEKKNMSMADDAEKENPIKVSASWSPADEEAKWKYRTSSPEDQEKMKNTKQFMGNNASKREPVEKGKKTVYQDKIKKKAESKSVLEKAVVKAEAVKEEKKKRRKMFGEEDRTAGRSIRGDE